MGEKLLLKKAHLSSAKTNPARHDIRVDHNIPDARTMATTSLLLPVLAAAATPRASSLRARLLPTRLDVRRAAPAKKRATSLVPRVGDDEIRDVVNDAAAVPPDVSPEDFNAFYRLLDSADAEQVEAKVKALVEGGGLTEGVLKAAFATLEQAQSRNDKPEIVASLQVR